MNYRTVFDVTRSRVDDDYWLILAGMPVVGLALTLLAFFAYEHLGSNGASVTPARKLTESQRTFVALGGLVFCSLTAALAWGSRQNAQATHATLARALLGGRCESVEGVVTRFDPMPYHGHRPESFEVAGRRFSFSDYSPTAGYHRSLSHGGALKEGVQVRIAHLGNDIAKLEVAR